MEDVEILCFIKLQTGDSIGLSAITPVVLMGHTVWSALSLAILLQGPRTVAMLVAL